MGSTSERASRSAALRAAAEAVEGFSEYVCDRRYPWTVICEREFGRAPGQLYPELEPALRDLLGR